MPAKICSDEEFISLWNKNPSIAEISKVLGCHVRTANSKRRSIENRLGIILKSSDIYILMLNPQIYNITNQVTT